MKKDKFLLYLSRFCVTQEDNYYHDEPHFFIYKSRIKNSPIREIHGTGTSFEKDLALIRALGEAVERYALIPKDDTDIFYKGSNKIPLKDRIDISKFPIFFKDEDLLRKNSLNPMGWVRGYQLFIDNKTHKISTKKSYLPSQLIFVPYAYRDSEPFLQQPISTGANFNRIKHDALISGILEVIERDSFVISYYTRTAISKVNIEKISDKDISHIRSELKRCFLEYHFMEISTMPNIHVILCILFDKRKSQPLMVSGLGTGFNLKVAIIKSTEEAMQLRPWLRDEFSAGKIFKVYAEEIRDYLDRISYWNYNLTIPKIKKRLYFYLDLPEKSINDEDLISGKDKSRRKVLFDLILSCNKARMDVYFIDITPKPMRKKGIVIKVIIPQAQSFFLNEKHKLLKGKRIQSVGRIYDNHPHFFI